MKRSSKKSFRSKKSLFDAPSAQAPLAQKADYLELLALREADHDVSLQDLIEITDRADEDADAERDLPTAESDLALETESARTLDEPKQRVRHPGPATELYPLNGSEDLLAIRAPWGESPKDF